METESDSAPTQISITQISHHTTTNDIIETIAGDPNGVLNIENIRPRVVNPEKYQKITEQPRLQNDTNNTKYRIIAKRICRFSIMLFILILILSFLYYFLNGWNCKDSCFTYFSHL